MCDSCALQTPLVDYNSRAEFVRLAYQAQAEYVELIKQSVRDELLANDLLTNRPTHVGILQGLGTSKMSPIFHSDSFVLLQHAGTQALSILTKNTNADWCVRINKYIFRHLLRAAQNYANIVTYYAMYNTDINLPFPDASLTAGLAFKSEQCLEILTEELHYLFSGGFPICTVTEDGFVSHLLRKNFHLICRNPMWRLRNEAGARVILYPDFHFWSHSQMRAMLLVLCMGLHTRLGAHSVLQHLHADVMQKICMYISAEDSVCTRSWFQAEERWLY